MSFPSMCFVNFNPRAPCGARLTPSHAEFQSPVFQSTRPLRGATAIANLLGSLVTAISIHAPLAGRDRGRHARRASESDFNPRAPCGARPGCHTCQRRGMYFNPRAPCGARLYTKSQQIQKMNFNPRAPCGARQFMDTCHGRSRNFNPRAPCGARRTTIKQNWHNPSISTHAPLAGRDGIKSFNGEPVYHFNPRAPCGARRQLEPDG